MARILKWREKLVLACVTLFFSLTRAWPLGTYKTASPGHPVYSRLVTGMNRKTAFGVEVMAQKPYVRLVRASLYTSLKLKMSPCSLSYFERL